MTGLRDRAWAPGARQRLDGIRCYHRAPRWPSERIAYERLSAPDAAGNRYGRRYPVLAEEDEICLGRVFTSDDAISGDSRPAASGLSRK